MSAGLAPFGALSPVDIARLMQQARPQVDVSADDVPAAIPPGFTGFVPPTAPTMQPQVSATAPAVEPEAPARAPLRMFGALPPQMSAPVAAEPERSSLPSLVGSRAPALPVGAPAAPRGDVEAPAAAGPARPLIFGSLPAPTAPATTGSTAAPAAAAPTAAMPAAEPSLLDRIGDGLRSLNANGGGDLLTSLGIGLMSTPGFGRGAAAGLKAYQDNEGKRAASDLARAEFGLKVRKDAQEQRQLSGNAQYVASKIPGISPDQALTLGGNSTFMNELFKGVLPPAELYKQYTDADGNRWNRNERTGQETVALQAKDDKTVTPVSEADRVALGLPAGSYQKDANGKISPINATGTTINMGGEKAYDAEVGKAYAKQFTDLQTGDRNARNKLNTLALMEQAMNTPGFYSGVGGDGVKRANQFLGALGVKDAKAASGAEVMDALGNQIVLDQLGGSLGAGISDSDRKSIALIGPSIQKTPEGNKQLIGIYRSVAQREQQVAQMARDYAKANGGRIDAGFDDQVSRFANENPLFPAASRAAQAQSDGVSGPTAAPGIAAPRTQADFDALPKGAMYVDPADGRRYRKN